MAETFRLRHPHADTTVEVTAARRDTLLERGYIPVEGSGVTKPTKGQKRRVAPKPKTDEE